MKSLEQLLWSLDREGVEEVTLITDNAPYARVGAALEPIDDHPWPNEVLLRALVAFGGSRHVEDLSETPKLWTARVQGLGMINVAALQRGEEVQARFKVGKREARSIPPSSSPSVSSPRIQIARPATNVPLVTTRLPAQRVIPAITPLPPAPPPPSARPATLRKDTPTVAMARPPMPTPKALELDLPPIPPLEPLAPPPAVMLLPLSTPAPPVARAAPPPPAPAAAPLTLPPQGSSSPPSAPGLATLLANARDAGASDLHIISGRPPLYRVAGDLRPEGAVIEAGRVERMVMPVVPERLHRVLAENGSCDFALTHAEGRFRVNVCRQLTGLKACLRLVSKEVPTVEALKLHVGIAAAAQHHQGLIIFTGPTGHGKTTTMNAVVDRINRSTSHHVITVEDPIEHLHHRHRALMSQREVGTHTASFASALKASLREDPDVIVVGELRDVETVRMAVAASETGHLVLGTMNTPNAARTIDRLIDLFPPADQPQVRLTLAAGLRLIVSQRLVPGPRHDRMHAAFEILPSSVPLSALIRDGKTFQIPSLQQRGKALGIVRLDDSLVDLIAQDRVSLDDAKAVADAPQELEALLAAHRAAPR